MGRSGEAFTPPKWVFLPFTPIVFAVLTYVLLKGEKQYADIHDLRYVGVLPNNLGATTAATAPRRKSKYYVPTDQHSVLQKNIRGEIF